MPRARDRLPQVTPARGALHRGRDCRRACSTGRPTRFPATSRNSNGITLRGGLAYSADPILKGEVALGWRHQSYVDSSFDSFDLPHRRRLADLVADAAHRDRVRRRHLYRPGQRHQRLEHHRLRSRPSRFSATSGAISRSRPISATRTSATSTSTSTRRPVRRRCRARGNWSRRRGSSARLEQEYFQSAVEGGSYPTTTATIERPPAALIVCRCFAASSSRHDFWRR